jgi:hypothetical protein
MPRFLLSSLRFAVLGMTLIITSPSGALAQATAPRPADASIAWAVGRVSSSPPHHISIASASRIHLGSLLPPLNVLDHNGHKYSGLQT